MTPSSYGPFDATLSEEQNQFLRRLIRRGFALGIGEQVVADFKVIGAKLRDSPREWGDPLRSLDKLKLLIYRGIHHKISVTYGVHDRLPIVFIQKIELILNHPLAEREAPGSNGF